MSRPRSSDDHWNIADASIKRPCTSISVKPLPREPLKLPNVSAWPRRVPAPSVVSWDTPVAQGRDQGKDQGTDKGNQPTLQASLGPQTLLSQRPLASQDGIFKTPAAEPKEVQLAAANALLGRDSFLAVYDPSPMTMQLQAYRMQGLSLRCTSALLAHCAATGSLIRRLEYTVAKIDEMEPGRVMIGLAAAIGEAVQSLQRDFTALLLPAPPPLLQLLADATAPIRSIYCLSRLLGCHDLDRPARLNSLPSAAQLLNNAYAEALDVQGSPALYKMLWELLGRAATAWIAQLNTMLGLGEDADCYLFEHPKFITEKIPDMFAREGPGLFELDLELVPVFMSPELAEGVIEALNCCVLLARLGKPLPNGPPLVWSASTPVSAQRSFIDTETGAPAIRDLLVSGPVDPFSSSVLELKHQVPRVAKWAERDAPLDPALAILFILAPVAERVARLSQHTVTVMLQDEAIGLTSHLTAIVKLLLLEHGPLFASIADPIAWFHKGDSTRAQIALATALDEAIQDLGIPNHVAACLEFRTDADRVYLSYSVPVVLEPFLGPIVESCTRVNMQLIELQQQIRKSAQLQAFTAVTALEAEMQELAFSITTRNSRMWKDLAKSNQSLRGLFEAIHMLGLSQ